MVDRTGEVLQARGIRSTSIVGGRTRQERSSAVSLFTTEPSIKVILLTTGSAAAGACMHACACVNSGCFVPCPRSRLSVLPCVVYSMGVRAVI